MRPAPSSSSPSPSPSIGRSARPLSLSFGAAPRRARGFSLIVSLMMLIVIIILGVSASQMAVNEERGARNDRDRQIAFQAAEAAIRDAEFEIYGAGSPGCTVPGQSTSDRMRRLTSTCFNATNNNGYVYGCSAPPNAGLCAFSPAAPAYLDATNVDFFKDASQASGANYHTVAYGQYTLRTYPTQATAGLSTQPLSKYLPRYIIERVLKNTSISAQNSSDVSGNAETLPYMFRITAMGFGANPNSQVVLQAIVATQN